MTKAILLSVKPQHATKILNGKKTLELRKSVPQNFEGWVYIYITKPQRAGENLMWFDYTDNTAPTYALTYYGKDIMGEDILNGKVVARFWFDEWEDIVFDSKEGDYYVGKNNKNWEQMDESHLKRLQLTNDDVLEYDIINGYAWEIKQLEIFDEPMELSEIYKLVDFRLTNSRASFIASMIEPLTKAPKGWRYVWVD